MPEMTRVVVPPADTPVSRDEVAEARLALGLSLTDFGRLLGVHRFTVARWEAGQVAVENARMWRWALRAIKTAFDAARDTTP